MVHIQDIKVLHQLLSVDQVGTQLEIIAVALPCDLLDDELGVTFHMLVSDPKGQSYT
jgi:hypothetical protein